MNALGNARNDDLRLVDFPASDQPLREDVNRLGALVGDILAEQGGAQFLAEVEALRTAAIHRRETDASADELAALLHGVEPARAKALVRAFATYFQAVNVAERVHRIRRRREYERAGAAPQPGSLQATIAELVGAGVGADELNALFARLHVEPVFTAHPTEAVRRSLLDKEQAVVDGLLADLDRMQTPNEQRADLERMRVALTAGWQTAEAAPERPRVADEMEHIGYVLVEILYAVVPALFEALRDALDKAGVTDVALPDLLRFGTWVGGDMDGNPNVGAPTVAATLSAQRLLVLGAYRRELEQLGGMLTQSLSEVGVSAEIAQKLAGYRLTQPAATKLKARYDDMPYRQLLVLISARLAATGREQKHGYADPSEFRADIAAIDSSLRAHRGGAAGAQAVRRLLHRIDTFGFHLAALDLRQESATHAAACAALLADTQWLQRTPEQRVERLCNLLASGEVLPEPHAPAAQAVLEVLRTAQIARRRYGLRALGPYIISMSHSAADVLTVLLLARAADHVDRDGQVPLDVAPLFETIDDLHAAPDILRTLFAQPVYRRHLQARENRQIVMLGYSDSAKDGGLFASRWALQSTQAVLTELAHGCGIRIVFFHGRGGSVSRGGGKTERAIIAAPRGSVDGWLRLTEQGEVIHRKYGIRAIALRNLEQTTSAVLRASLRPRPPEPREARWREMVTAMAAISREAFLDLVKRDEKFPDYFRAATPIDVIERLRIGSRPPRRGGSGGDGGIERLRAIPWVFAWSQNRSGLTAWYGVGTALQAGIQSYGLDSMREMARDWAFFGTLVEDVEMVMAKCDLAIFERYSHLAGQLHDHFFPGIAAEFASTRRAVLAVRSAADLLDNDRRLRLSIRLRNPYVDPISLLQVDLLARWRASGRNDEALLRALIATVNGIAAGVQNTG
jgi:phosphoenolpyruvate carboxylase